MLEQARVYGVVAPLGFALMWVAAAVLVAGTTFHLAPAIVAASAPFTTRRVPGRALLIGIGITLGVGAFLAAAGRLDGPSLLAWGDARFETVVAALGGGLTGLGARRLVSRTP